MKLVALRRCRDSLPSHQKYVYRDSGLYLECTVELLARPILRAPDVITHDTGKNLTSREFVANYAMMDIRLEYVPKQTLKSMIEVERYNGPLFRELQAIDRDAPATPVDLVDETLWNRRYDITLQMACK